MLGRRICLEAAVPTLALLLVFEGFFDLAQARANKAQIIVEKAKRTGALPRLAKRDGILLKRLLLHPLRRRAGEARRSEFAESIAEAASGSHKLRVRQPVPFDQRVKHL